MKPLILAHPGEVEHAIAKNGVVVKDLVELAQFEKDDLVVVLLFDLPKLSHAA